MSRTILTPKKVKIPAGYFVVEKGKLQPLDKVYNAKTDQFQLVTHAGSVWVEQCYLVIRKNENKQQEKI